MYTYSRTHLYLHVHVYKYTVLRPIAWHKKHVMMYVDYKARYETCIQCQQKPRKLWFWGKKRKNILKSLTVNISKFNVNIINVFKIIKQIVL